MNVLIDIRWICLISFRINISADFFFFFSKKKLHHLVSNNVALANGHKNLKKKKKKKKSSKVSSLHVSKTGQIAPQ